MGKRSDFERVDRDFYPTPLEAVLPLLAHLAPASHYVEPCAGDGALVAHLATSGHVCDLAYDIEPRAPGIATADALAHTPAGAALFVSNPPWTRKILHPLITHLSDLAPAWLLFDADWIHTRQAIPFLPRLRKIVAVGRVKWIPDSAHSGKDNCCWYLFERPGMAKPKFYGKTLADALGADRDLLVDAPELAETE